MRLQTVSHGVISVQVANVSPYSVPLCINLYNQIAANSPTIVKLKTPSVSNLQPMTDARGRIRFGEYTMAIQRLQALSRSPRKKPRMEETDFGADAVDRWKEGVQKMLREYEDEGESDADPFPALNNNNNNTKPPTTKAARHAAPTPAAPRAASPFVPAPPDPTLDIPGELVLAREKNGSTVYWPAKLEEYVCPQGPRQKPKYRVEFLDRSTMAIPRNWFYTSEEPEFATCKVRIFLR
jgi:hypothetical protein